MVAVGRPPVAFGRVDADIDCVADLYVAMRGQLQRVGLCWDAGMTDWPDSYADLSAHAGRTPGIERSYTESNELAGALAGFTGVGGPTRH